MFIIREDEVQGLASGESFKPAHPYPFDTLPLLESHLQPKFVIFDAGQKLAESEQNEIQNLVDVFPSLQFSSIMALYSAWIRPPPAKAKEDLTYNVPDDDDDNSYDSEDEDQTKSGRPHQEKLYKATLSTHNQQFWTDDRIREWSKPCQKRRRV